jgi:hypothetical protein
MKLKGVTGVFMNLFLFWTITGFSQTDTLQNAEEEMDFSQFAGDAEVSTAKLDDGVKRFCTSKITGISPTKLISLGYDFQSPYTLTTNEKLPNALESSIQATHGLRLAANFPVISRNAITINLGLTYLESNYALASGPSNPLAYSLDQSALRSTGLNLTIFKPLNEKHFILVNSSHDLNGDYRLNEWQNPKYIKHSVLAVFGWKKHDRRQFGIGVARTYRVGEVNYIPVILYNYTSRNGKWGIESFLPARFHYRRTFSPRSMLFAGFELEGNSYRLRNRDGAFNSSTNTYSNLELRRSELRFRLVYERSLYKFLWISIQAGYRYNYSFNVDDGEFFRGFFGEQTYVMENKLSNPFYTNISLNLVSP